MGLEPPDAELAAEEEEGEGRHLFCLVGFVLVGGIAGMVHVIYTHIYTGTRMHTCIQNMRTGVALLMRKSVGVRMTSEKTRNSGVPPRRRVVSAVLVFSCCCVVCGIGECVLFCFVCRIGVCGFSSSLSRLLAIGVAQLR